MIDYFSNYRQAYEKIYETFKKRFKDCDVSFEELIIYITAPNDTGDITAPEEILGNEYYLYHELVEICYLKKWGIRIDKYTILMNPGRCYEAHYYAIKHELELAKMKNDKKWIEKRLRHIESYLEDPRADANLKQKFRNILREYSD